jgi:hypothetical protein
VDTLLDVVGNLAKTASGIVPGGATVLALDVAKSVYAGFGSLIGLKSLEPLVQAESGRALPGTGSGYLVLANAPPDELNGENISVCEGKLCRDNKLITNLDYCLIAIERYSSILEEATGTSPDLFDNEWQEVVASFEAGVSEASKSAMRRLQSAIRSSPALIDSDRTAAMGAYLQRYMHEVTVLDPLRGAGDELAKTLTDSVESLEATQAGDKLSTILGMVDAVQRSSSDEVEVNTSLELAKETRNALQAHGDGDDAALADALLRAV